jgi:predicted transcriptional regulator
MFTSMDQAQFPKVFAVRLGPDEAKFLDRLARQNDRSRSAELRRLLRREREASEAASQSQNFARTQL